MSKEEEFKQRFAAVMKDLNADGRHDPEAMWVLGSIAAQIVDQAKAKSWAALRRDLARADYDKLVTTFQQKGNEFVAAGNHKAAYAVQALAMSVVSRSQTDPQVVEGGQLLDGLVDRAIAFFRQNPPNKQT